MNETLLADGSASRASLLPFQLIVPILFAGITVCGVVGNLAVIVVFTANRGFQDSTNALIMNLALADLLFLTLCVPFTAYSYMRSIWPFGRILCYVNVYLQYVSAYASVWTLVLLAFDRFLAVVHPVSAMQMRTGRNTLRSCILLWLVMFAANSPLVFTSDLLEYQFEGENRSLCLDFAVMAMGNATGFQVGVFYFGFNIGAYVLPLGVTCVFYIMMIRRLWRPVGELRISREAIRVKRRITKLVWIVTLTFAICWLPQNIRYAWMAFVYPEPISHDHDSLLWFFFVGAQILAYTNSCVNPILYGVLSERFREGIANLLRRIQGKPAKYRLHCNSSAPRLVERSTLAVPTSDLKRTDEPTEVSEMLHRRRPSPASPARFFVGQSLVPTTHSTNGFTPIDTTVHIGGVDCVVDKRNITQL